jgi:acyl carrier protein
MLTGRPTPAQIRATIHRAIVELLDRAGTPVRPFDDHDDLAATGLSSLDLAALVARLERQWKIDPFLETRSITEVRTVGDFCRAYEECLNGG